MKFEILDPKQGCILLYGKMDENLINVGDIRLKKESDKAKSFYYQRVKHFNYHGIENALCGKNWPNKFTPKRIFVIQMQ